MPPEIRANYHTHTFRCKHASGSVDEYCAEALRQGLEVLGMSDHVPLPDGRWPDVRMGLEELPLYLAEIGQARKKYPRLQILAALECEYAPAYRDFYRHELLERLRLDYLVGAVHWFPHAGEWHAFSRWNETPGAIFSYAAHVVEMLESGLFAFLAHPDVFAGSQLTWDDDIETGCRTILAAAEKTGVPLEINGYGLRKPKIESEEGLRCRYPWERFWRLAGEYRIRVVVNSDAHRPQDVGASMDECIAIAARYGLEVVHLSFAGEAG